MGYYIQTEYPRQKAFQIIKQHNAEAIPKPASFSDVPTDKALIVVVENALFDAAAHCYSERELEAFTYPDDRRPKTFLLMDLKKAQELSRFNLTSIK